MTYAPKALLDARAYLLSELDVKPGVPRSTDLEPNEVGIVGNTKTHFGGYHLGWDRIRLNLGRGDYSVAESPRDGKPTDAASALDIGQFHVRSGDRALTLPHLSLWLVAQCGANAPDTRDIREIIYSPDGRVVRRWDRLGRRSTGDSSHLYHTHISYFRDSEHRDKTALFRRYIEGDRSDALSVKDRINLVHKDGTATVESALSWMWNHIVDDLQRGKRIEAKQDAMLAAIAGQDVVAAVEAKLSQHHDELIDLMGDLMVLVQQAQSGEIDATEIVNEIGRRLTPATDVNEG